jgi:hypothetical protein
VTRRFTPHRPVLATPLGLSFSELFKRKPVSATRKFSPHQSYVAPLEILFQNENQLSTTRRNLRLLKEPGLLLLIRSSCFNSSSALSLSTEPAARLEPPSNVWKPPVSLLSSRVRWIVDSWARFENAAGQIERPLFALSFPEDEAPSTDFSLHIDESHNLALIEFDRGVVILRGISMGFRHLGSR